MISVEREGWNISAYTSPVPRSDDFLKLAGISDADRIFIEEHIRKSRYEIFLLKSGKRSLLLSTHMYFSSGLVFAVMLDEPIELSVALIERGEFFGVKRSPSCEDIIPMKRLSAKRRERAVTVFDYMRLLSEESGVFSEAAAYPLYLRLAEKARLVASFTGVNFEIENGGVFGNVENYDVALYDAFLLLSAAYIKRVGMRRDGKLTFYYSRDKLYVKLETEVLSDTRIFEFEFLKRCAEALEIGFFVTEEKGKTVAYLCSHRPDLSKIGLKNDIFLI